MLNIWIYSLLSAFIASLISFMGVFTLSMKIDKLKKIVFYLISFSAGALLADAFFHLIPHTVEEAGFSISIMLYVILGILVSFIIEKVVHWRHCHEPTCENHPHPFAIMNLVGDMVHNFLDGIIIGVSYLGSISVGIATTIAVIFHEIPQEIGDFGVLIHGGFSKGKALLYNFLTALTAILGVIVSLLVGLSIENLAHVLIPFAAGTFIYIANADLIPEMHKEISLKKSLLQLLLIILGGLVIVSLMFFE